MQMPGKDQASVDAYHASTQYLKTIGILFSQGIASKFPQSYQFPAPIAGFEKKIPAENGNEVEEGTREQA
jgi:hypothetical protein